MRIRDWTLREIAQGKPWGHPTHAMFVHFPTALLPAALIFDVLSRVQSSDHATQTATILLGLGLAGSTPAVFTGLIDWLGMVPGSTKRGVATRHMLYQLGAQVLAAAAFTVHLRRLGATAPTSGLVLLSTSVVVMFAGNWLGGVLVYRMAMRVGGSREPARPRQRVGQP
jgi:uncharacterized membrane protein